MFGFCPRASPLGKWRSKEIYHKGQGISLMPFRPAEGQQSPAVVKISRVDDRVFALGQWDFSEGVAVAQLAV